MKLTIKEGNFTYEVNFPSDGGHRPSCTEVFQNFILLMEKVYSHEGIMKAYCHSDPECIVAQPDDALRLAYNKYGDMVRQHLAVIDDHNHIEELEPALSDRTDDFEE